MVQCHLVLRSNLFSGRRASNTFIDTITELTSSKYLKTTCLKLVSLAMDAILEEYACSSNRRKDIEMDALFYCCP
jgi:hypothetical protein